MNRRTVNLLERRPRRVRLGRAEVGFLLAHARHVIELAPGFERNTYTLTPRGSVGFLDGPTTRYAIQPKIPWPNLRLLLGLSPNPGGEPANFAAGLLAAFATEFTDRLEAVTRTGLVSGYREAASVSPYLRGRLRTGEQMRDAASRAFPDRFHIDEPVFDLNTPWNRVVRATAAALLRHPTLPAPIKQRVDDAARPLASIADSPITAADFASPGAEPRVAHYAPLLDLCRLILNGLPSANPYGLVSGSFLIDLGVAFERYLTASLARAFEANQRWRVEAHPGFALGPTVLRPDVVVQKNGTPHTVLDAKWKRPVLDATDLHQILAYAVLTGAPRVGLVYPGRTNGHNQFVTPDGRVIVCRYRLRVVGTAAELAESVALLARAMRRR